MITIAIIPARLDSTRFPGKLMADLGGKTVIRRTYENVVATGLFDDVLVATDAPIIFNEIITHGGKALMSRQHHESGSDRIAEAAHNITADIIVNVQGDEPFMSKEPLAALLEVFRDDTYKSIDLASLMCPITTMEGVHNPNVVKVVTDATGLALYFSRAPIPFPRDNNQGQWFQHIGVYAFRRQAIIDFSTWPVSALESVEKLEQLRYLEAGKRIKMVLTQHTSIGIDTPEDLEKARGWV